LNLSGSTKRILIITLLCLLSITFVSAQQQKRVDLSLSSNVDTQRWALLNLSEKIITDELSWYYDFSYEGEALVVSINLQQSQNEDLIYPLIDLHLSIDEVDAHYSFLLFPTDDFIKVYETHLRNLLRYTTHQIVQSTSAWSVQEVSDSGIWSKGPFKKGEHLLSTDMRGKAHALFVVDELVDNHYRLYPLWQKRAIVSQMPLTRGRSMSTSFGFDTTFTQFGSRIDVGLLNTPRGYETHLLVGILYRPDVKYTELTSLLAFKKILSMSQYASPTSLTLPWWSNISIVATFGLGGGVLIGENQVIPVATTSFSVAMRHYLSSRWYWEIGAEARYSLSFKDVGQSMGLRVTVSPAVGVMW
jgi:hypothetical protein